MRIRFRGVLLFIITVVAVIICGARGIAADVDPAACPRTLPANIELPRDLERVLARVYRGSATFRGQVRSHRRRSSALGQTAARHQHPKLVRGIYALSEEGSRSLCRCACASFQQDDGAARRSRIRTYCRAAGGSRPADACPREQVRRVSNVLRGLREHACATRGPQRGCRGRDAANGGLIESIIRSACSRSFSIGSRTTDRSLCSAC